MANNINDLYNQINEKHEQARKLENLIEVANANKAKGKKILFGGVAAGVGIGIFTHFVGGLVILGSAAYGGSLLGLAHFGNKLREKKKEKLSQAMTDINQKIFIIRHGNDVQNTAKNLKEHVINQ